MEVSDLQMVSCDIGATKCCCAIVQYHHDSAQYRLIRVATVPLNQVSSFLELINALEQALAFNFAQADAICIGAAGRYNSSHIELTTGYPYAMNVAEVAKIKQWRNYDVVHDYVPLACSTFAHPDQHMYQVIHQGKHNPYGRRLILGVGSGLGIKDCVLFPNGRFWYGDNEAGHCGVPVPPLTVPQKQIFHNDFMSYLNVNPELARHEGVTFEKILSGKGLSRLHQFLTNGAACIAPEVIGEKANDPTYSETWRYFAWYLGLFVGTMQLMFMPNGGIWLGGGVIQKNSHLFELNEFYEGIHATPAYLQDRNLFPIYAFTGVEHFHYGAAFYAKYRMLISPTLSSQ